MLKPASLLLFLFCIALSAEPVPDSLKTFHLPTIRVIVGKPSEAIGSLQQINLQDSKDALSLREALSNVVGISASVGTKDESSLKLRGFRKNELKIMINGRPINNGYFGNVDISKLSTLDIQEIQVVKGPASPLFGSGSMGGVINLITSEPSSHGWLSLSSTIKRNNTHDIQISSSHGFSAWSYRVGFAGLHSDGFVLSRRFHPTFSENGGVRNLSAKEQYNFSSSINADVFTFHKLGFDISYSGMDHKDIPSSIYERKYRLYKDWKRYNAGLTGEFRLSDSTVLTSLISYDGAGDRYLEYNDAQLQYVNVDSRMHNISWGMAPRIRYQANGGDIWDFGYRYELQSNRRKDNGAYPVWTSNKVQYHSVFCQYERTFNNSIRFTTGLGISSSLLAEPALGIAYTSPSGGTSSLAVGINTSPPTMRQLFSYDKGNPDLKPQSSLKLELSHLQPLLLDTVTISGSVFYNDCRNLIDLQGSKYNNIYQFISEGAELGIILSPLSWYELRADYSFLEYKKNSDYRLTETPKHSAEFSHRLKFPAKSVLTLSSSYRGSRFSLDGLGVYHNLEAYWLHDIRLQIPWHSLQFRLGMDNILDADYQGEYGFPEAGRDFSIGVEIRI
jgi:outer membrane cobalamin receptor